MRSRALLGFVCLVSLSNVSGAIGQVNVLTANYDLARTNSNPNETILTPRNVNGTQFGRVFALPVDGHVFAQPLYVSQVAIPGQGTHNLLLVVTMHNTVYAFDADAWDGMPLWQINLGPSVPGEQYNFQDAYPEVGILGTPAIDLASGTIYLVSDHFNNGTFTYLLHALDLTTGAEKQGAAVPIQATSPVPFDPSQHLQRPGLLLANGMVYIAFGSHNDDAPYHGWIFAYDQTDIQHQTAVFNTTPNGGGGAIWQSGRGLAADAAGAIYAATGNGSFDGVTEFGESFLKLDAGLHLTDWFAPDNWAQLNDVDYDLGSSGLILVPGTDLVLGGGKSGFVFVTKSGALGQTQMGNGQVVESFNPAQRGVYTTAVWNSPTGPILYLESASDVSDGFRLLSTGKFETVQSLRAGLTSGTPFGGLAISSNGTMPGTGVIWAITAATGGPTDPATLVALEAENPANILWTSAANPFDQLGYFPKFVTPTVANGKVYMPTFSNQVVVYGLNQTLLDQPQITTLLNSASFSPGPVSPGEIVTIFGEGLGPSTNVSATPVQGAFPTSLAATTVTFDGVNAPVMYVSSTQVNTIVPFEVAGPTTHVKVSFLRNSSADFVQPVVAATPALFSIDASGAGQGAFLNQDLSINSANNPASPGQVLVIYGTGNGLYDPDPTDGALVGGMLQLAQTPTVTIGGMNAAVQYSGAAPGEVAGLVQINALIPAGVTPGNAVPVTVQIGDVVSQPGITAAIQ